LYLVSSMVHMHPERLGRCSAVLRRRASIAIGVAVAIVSAAAGGCAVSPHAGLGTGVDTSDAPGAALVFDSPAVRSARRESGRPLDLTNPEYGRRDTSLGVREVYRDRSRDEGRTVIDRRRRSLEEPYREVRRGHISPRTLYRRDFR